MDAESLFSIFFVGFVAFIPFTLARMLGRELYRQNEEIPATISKIKETTGRVVGYTKGYPNESGGDYHAIVEHITEGGDVIWAENSAQKNKDYEIGKDVQICYSPDDPRNITIGDYRYLMKGDRLMTYIIAAFSLVVSLSLLFYFKFPSLISSIIIAGYLSGLVWGYRFGSRSELKIANAARDKRDKRLTEAQEIGDVPCNLEV